MRKLLLSLIVLSALFLTGCKNAQSTRLFAQNSSMFIAAVALQESPSARPYLRLAAPIICAAAATNAPPAVFTASIEGVEPNLLGIAIVNSILGIGFSFYEAGDPNAQAAMLGVCDGLSLALSMSRRHVDYPRVRFKK